MKWNWQLPKWPELTCDATAMASLESAFLQVSGRAAGASAHFSGDDRESFRIELLTDEAMQSSRIEGEMLDRASVQSSLRKNFGLKQDRHHTAGVKEQGIADLVTASWNSHAEPLVDEMLCRWHGLLMQTQLSDRSVGCYRSDSEPMQIVSGDLFDPEVHFEAPPSAQVAAEMADFVTWFNATAPTTKAVPMAALTRSALAHLRFETIHPFADGNGRIGRAIAEKALSQAHGQPLLVALSQTIEEQRKAYYEALAATRYTLDVTEWVTWFGEIVLASVESTLRRIEFVIQKTHFFAKFGARLNERQAKMLRRMFREGPTGFAGGLSAGNYLSISKTSAATARRDLGDLVEMGALTRTGERKGTRYFLRIGEG